MTASIPFSQGRLRFIMENWQGEDVYLTVSGRKTLIDPQYLEQQVAQPHPYQKYISNKKYGSGFKKDDVYKYSSHNQQPYAKQNMRHNMKSNDYVFNAHHRSRQRKGKSFSQLLEQYSNCQPHNGNKQRKNKTGDHKYQFQFPKQKINMQYYRKTPKYIIPDEEQVQQRVQGHIQQSLKDLGIANYPQKENNTIMRKIQELKKEMVDKIVKESNSSPEEDLAEIIDEIKVATQQIISNHSRKKSGIQIAPHSFVNQNQQYPKEPILQKQIFSFEGGMKDDLIFEADEDEEQTMKDKNLSIKIPQFKDNNESISSIMSFNNEYNNDIMQSPSVKSKTINIIEAKDEVFNKENIDVVEKQDDIHEIKPLLIETPQNSVLKDEFKEIPTTIQKRQNPEKEEQKLPMIKNYKIEFLDSRVKETEVIRLSPLRFRKKEQVVHHLVKQKIVEKQSDSIEFI